MPPNKSVDPHYAMRCALDLLYAKRPDEAVAMLLRGIGWIGTLQRWNEHQAEIREGQADAPEETEEASDATRSV